jgi:hypothetical protein
MDFLKMPPKFLAPYVIAPAGRRLSDRVTKHSAVPAEAFANRDKQRVGADPAIAGTLKGLRVTRGPQVVMDQFPIFCRFV